MTRLLHYLGAALIALYAVAVVAAVLSPLIHPVTTVVVLGIVGFLWCARTLEKKEEKKADGNPPP